MNIRALYILLVLAVLTLCVGCNRRVTLAAAGHEMAQSLPSSGTVHPYEGLPISPEPGPLVAVYISGPTDLERLAEKWTHHLYFELISCADQRRGPLLFTGPVFKASRNEHEKMLPSRDSKNVTLYKIYVPLSTERLVSDDRIYGPFDVKAYRESARVGGICLRLRGGNMAGFGLESNVVKAPLKLNGASKLQVDPAASTKN